MIVFPGQRVITTQGTVRTVAYVSVYGVIYGYSPKGHLEVIQPRCDAWGGDADLNFGVAA